MKKVYIIISSIILCLTVILLLNNKSDKVSMYVENATYAMTLNNEKINDFPERGLYSINIDCENATGSWDYTNWKLKLSNVTGNISCNISFSTITEKTYLRPTIQNLAIDKSAITSSMTEAVVNEYDYIAPLTATYTIQPMNYTLVEGRTPSISSNKYTTNFNSTYKTMSLNFTPQSNGYYKLCFSSPKKNIYSSFYAKISYNAKNNPSQAISFESQTSIAINTCYEYGYLTTSDTINVTADTNSSTGEGQFTIWFTKTDTYNTQQMDTRYEGKDAKNYVLFNDELWRIIGIFGDNSHGQTGKNLVKIVRNKPISAKFDFSNSNIYGNDATSTYSSLYNLLNKTYYDWNTYKDEISDYCYNASASKNCDFSKIGIKSNYRNMIQEVKWNIGEFSNKGNNERTTDIPRTDVINLLPLIYLTERTANYSVTGKIGLMYPSDYGFTILDKKTCSGAPYIISRDYCAKSSWVTKYGNEYLLNPAGSYSGSYDTIASISSYGNVSAENITNQMNLRPTLYLKDEVYIIAGNGTKTNPYIIGMD